MAESNENFPGVIGPANPQGGLGAGGGKFGAEMGQNRKPLSTLSTINRGIIGAPPHPCAGSKRGGGALQERNAVPSKISPPIPVHRPMTRNFAAQMASKQQHPILEEKRPPVQTTSYISEPEDSSITDADDFNAPMFVQQTEAMLEEIDRMDREIEMEDIDEEPVMDIDSNDKNNILAVVEYIDEIYANYRKEESSSCVSPNYMSQQFDINERMRGILIDWLIEVQYKFDLMEETLYLTVNLIDRFLSVHTVVRKKLQLVGVTALLLACKYEEVSVPVVEDLILISDKAYTRKEVLDMEKLMVNTLQFCLSVPTPYVFMNRFLKAAQSDKKLELLSFYLIELCLVEYEMLKFPPSLLAAAAIFTAQSTLGGSKQWSKTSEKHSDYFEYQLLECSKMMVILHQKAATGKLTGVHRKYSTSKYGYAAKTEPAHFILESRF